MATLEVNLDALLNALIERAAPFALASTKSRTDIAHRDIDPAPVIVREQVLEDRPYQCSDVACFAQRHRLRDRQGLLPSEPLWIVRKVDRTAALPVERPYPPSVEEDTERSSAAARHQKIFSMSEELPRVRS